MKNKKKALELFWYFFRIGWFTFGGGWSIVAQIQKEYVEKRKEINEQELLDMISVGRSLPGTMIGDVAYLFGYHLCGVAGGVLSVLGVITPPLLMLIVITICYENVRDNVLIARALIGVRACVAPVIFSATLKLQKNAFPQKICYLLMLTGLVLTLFFHVSCVLLVIVGAVAGCILQGQKGRDGSC